MEMAQYLVCVFTVAVYLGGATANTINLLSCILNQVKIITPDNMIREPANAACQDIEVKFHRAMPNLKHCLGFDIDISKLESLYHEYCSSDSDFRQKVERQKNCLSSNFGESRYCASIGMKYNNVVKDQILAKLNLPWENMEKAIHGLCQRLSEEMVTCLREYVGGPCEPEGLEVYGRIANVTEPLTKGSCVAAASFELERPVSFKDFEKAVEPSTTESGTYANTETTYNFDVDVEWFATQTEPSMAVTVHSLTYMLTGMIFAVIYSSFNHARLC